MMNYDTKQTQSQPYSPVVIEALLDQLQFEDELGTPVQCAVVLDGEVRLEKTADFEKIKKAISLFHTQVHTQLIVVVFYKGSWNNKKYLYHNYIPQVIEAVPTEELEEQSQSKKQTLAGSEVKSQKDVDNEVLKVTLNRDKKDLAVENARLKAKVKKLKGQLFENKEEIKKSKLKDRIMGDWSLVDVLGMVAPNIFGKEENKELGQSPENSAEIQQGQFAEASIIKAIQANLNPAQQLELSEIVQILTFNSDLIPVVADYINNRLATPVVESATEESEPVVLKEESDQSQVGQDQDKQQPQQINQNQNKQTKERKVEDFPSSDFKSDSELEF